ncbi:venom allergen 5-like [Cylas formicarius]|uniref:venom allergen 5-like n=1 Tax=Cylas formicarius TaxID=197179 RepID=UPI0029589B7C|nr:venom allergen 5-like [Cylas formicarius]
MKWFFLTVLMLVAKLRRVWGECDQGVYDYGVTSKEKTYILEKHNGLRLLIARGKLEGQPRGINLKRMKWDDYLAAAAQNIANTCHYAHADVSDSRWQVGQNIFNSKSTNFVKGANWTAAIYSWWNEHEVYHYPNGFSYSTAHYTQMAWANTDHVGCGYTHYPIHDGQYNYQKFYVCNYGPAGNYDWAPYKTGNSGCQNLC